MGAVRSIRFLAMGSECALHLYDGGEEAELAAVDEVLRIERRFSRYRPDSLVSEINRAAAEGRAVELDPEASRLLDYAFACRAKSGGLFDLTTGILRRAWNFNEARLPSNDEIGRLLPYVGMDKLRWEPPVLSFPVPGVELDFGGIGKEYAADRAAAICRERGVRHGLVDLGGDLCVVGPPPDCGSWTVRIRHPRIHDRPLAMVALERGGLATSGDYERYIEVGGNRYCHILNPATGWPARGLRSASAVAGTCLVAGSLTTIAMLKAAEGASWLESLGLPCLWVDDAGMPGGSLPISPEFAPPPDPRPTV
ncbi:thiamine biosynthesis lipoprotein ApbE precursor [mine drainage metagenome]|uniref:FAD:protein FMN transferase n=1 Tax=mine drainage metagenome TaxID=410659 RepID=A0A1J5RYT6_9ZZZZ